MRKELITGWLTKALATTTPADLERVLAEALAELTEIEYTALQGKLLSAAANEAAQPIPPAGLARVVSQVMEFTQQFEGKVAISHVFTYADGSRIRVEVDAPSSASGYLATADYHAHILPALTKIDPTIKRD